MKRIISILIMIILTSVFERCTFNEGVYSTGQIEYKYEDVKDVLIRFHVLANSDTDEDQQLKIKVKNEIIKYLYPYLKDSDSLATSRKILKDNESEVINIAKRVIKESGYNYGVTTELGKENFPEKSYGNITLPQGEYEAFRVIIGDGNGHNWWCVMFPPLCFTDVTKGKVEEDKSKEELDKAVEDGKKSKDKPEGENKSEDKVKVKFKVVEVIEDIF